MKLADIISLDRVGLDSDVTSKKRAIEEIAALLAKDGTGRISGDDIVKGLAAREKLGSTGLGHGVAIPHGRIAGARKSVGAFLRLRHPVDYDSHDAKPVDLLFGLLVPDHADGEHLQQLATIADKFADEMFCEQLRRAADARALYTLLVD